MSALSAAQALFGGRPHGFVDRLDHVSDDQLNFMRDVGMVALLNVWHTNQSDPGYLATMMDWPNKIPRMRNMGIPIAGWGWCDGDGASDGVGMVNAYRSLGLAGLVPNCEAAHKYPPAENWVRTQQLLGVIRSGLPDAAVMISTLPRLDIQLFDDRTIDRQDCWVAMQCYHREVTVVDARPAPCIESAYRLPLHVNRDDGRMCRVSFPPPAKPVGIRWCQLVREDGKWRIRDGQNLWRLRESDRAVYRLDDNGQIIHRGNLLGVCARTRLTTTLQMHGGASGAELVSLLRAVQPRRPWGVWLLETSTADQRAALLQYARGG